MTGQMHPQVAEALHQLQRFSSALEDQQHRTNTESFTGTDEAESVQVTLDAHHWLTDLYLGDGVLRLGAEAVAQRINEALQNANCAATDAIRAEHDALAQTLHEIAQDLQKGLGFG